MNRNKCPKCGGETIYVEVSSGGDGMEECTECDWIEDFSKPSR